jgi:hypothetical protein
VLVVDWIANHVFQSGNSKSLQKTTLGSFRKPAPGPRFGRFYAEKSTPGPKIGRYETETS